MAGSFRAAWRRRRGLYLALAATWLPLGWMVIATGTRGGLAGFGLSVSWWSYFCTQFGAIVHYLRLCVWPHPLVFDYGAVVLTDATALALYASVIGLIGLATLAALWQWPKLVFLGPGSLPSWHERPVLCPPASHRRSPNIACTCRWPP